MFQSSETIKASEKLIDEAIEIMRNKYGISSAYPMILGILTCLIDLDTAEHLLERAKASNIEQLMLSNK
jgi:hypothetical protein